MTKAPVAREAPKNWAHKGRDRRRFWIQVVAWLLVLVMLLPVIIYFL